MHRRTIVLVLAVALVALTAVAMPGAATLDDGDDTAGADTLEGVAAADSHIEECAAEPPDDFADPEDGNEVIGWVDGFWYNEPLEIDIEDGISEAELENLSARTAARFEAMRCITADEGVPPVEIQTREEFQEEQAEHFADIDEETQLSQNAVFETMLMIPSTEDAIDVREENRGATVGGFYSFVENRIVVVTDDPENMLIDEEVLAHELGHAIQDQQFNLSRYERPTTDIDKGVQGLIEGDVDLVEHWYLDACEAGLWDEPCISEEHENGAGGEGPANWGLYFQSWQPYNDGPPFINYLMESEFDGDWNEVDAMYDDPPQSALHVTYPEKWGDVDLTDVEVPDRSDEDWERITIEDSLDYDELGIASISAMFKAPTYETNGQQNIYDPENILNTDAEGEIDDLQPVNYQHPETKGWRGDRIYTYQNDGEAGAVWTLEWVSEEDMEPFLRSYEDLVAFRGGELVDGYEHTYAFGEGSDYDMALTIVPDGSTVTIITAPAVEDLTAIHDVELVEAEDEETPTPTPTPSPADEETPTPTPVDDDDTEPSTPTPADDADDDGAGFGVVAGVLAVLLATLLVRRRNTR